MTKQVLPPKPPDQCLLRFNAGMIRDAFIADDNGEKVLGIRQTRFNEDGAQPDTKLIRLVPEEVEALFAFWNKTKNA